MLGSYFDIYFYFNSITNHAKVEKHVVALTTIRHFYLILKDGRG